MPAAHTETPDRSIGARPEGSLFWAVLASGFGVTVAMWAVGYLGHLPAVMLSGKVLVPLFLICLLAGGVLVGRHASIGWRGGILAGLVTGLLNLLVLGSLLTGDQPNQVVPSALIWIPGSIAFSAAAVGLGAWIGSRWAAGGERRVDWGAVLVRVAVAATLLLLAVGGLVTSKEAGLAVVDWPNSYGYNMFLYPLAKMTGGAYYEHAHRLFGALVGLATLVVAVYLQRVETRPFVRRLAWLAVVMVVVQGVLGGLRVTGNFTLSTSPEDMAPSLTLAVIHGVFGQVFFATLVALAALTSPEWRRGSPARRRRGAGTDHILGWVLVAMLIAQLVLGAVQRHTSNLLAVHIVMAGLVAPLALHLGLRAWGLNPDDRQLTRWGIALVATTGVQLTLGMGAFIAIGALEAGTISSTTDVTLTTAHQWCGAMLLACAVLVLCWNRRRLAAPA